MIDTVIFDLDGTLLYTLGNLYKSTNYALQTLGFPERSLDEIRSFVGNGVEKLIERSVPQFTTKEQKDCCLDVFKQHYSKTMYENTYPFDGIIEMLDFFNSKNIKCAVVSNKYDAAVKELCEKYFGSRIICAIGECNDVRRKPCPDGVLNVIKQLNSKKCVYVGDSEVDIQTAQNAKIPCISVSWGYKDKNFLLVNKACIIADNVDELVQYVLSLD